MADGSTDGFVLLNDLPVSRPDKDLLGTKVAAERVVQVLSASAEWAPFVIAVNADWGMGKSTLLQMVKTKLEAGPAERNGDHAESTSARDCIFKTVWFNAWTAEGDDALAELIKSVLTKLDARTVRGALRSVAKRKRLIAGIGLAVAGHFIGGVDRLVDELWTRTYLAGESRNRLREDIERMLKDWATRSRRDHKKRRLVVFVDDLDRCTDDVVVKVCEAVKQYLDVPGLIFVLACDQSVLARSVQDAARGGPSEARLYLEKIIQVQYRLPSPGEPAIEKLIKDYAQASRVPDLLEVEEVRTALVKGCGRNPRRIKRIINSFIMEAQLSRVWEDDPLLSRHYLLVAILLEHLYAQFYDVIVEDQSDDPITEFLDYAALRGALMDRRRQSQEPGQESTASLIHEFIESLAKHRVYPSRDDENDLGRVIGLLDKQVSKVFIDLVNDQCFVALLRSVPMESRRRFLEQLRNHPLVTESPQLPPGDYGTGRSRARSVKIIYEHQLIPDGASMTLELDTLVKPDVVQQVRNWMAEDPVRARVWWSPDPSRPLRWAVEPDRKWSPTALRDEIFRRAGLSPPSFSAADAWCYDGKCLYEIANSAFERS